MELPAERPDPVLVHPSGRNSPSQWSVEDFFAPSRSLTPNTLTANILRAPTTRSSTSDLNTDTGIPRISAVAQSLGAEPRLGRRAAAHYGFNPETWARRARQRHNVVQGL